MAEKKVNTTNEEDKKKKKKLFIIFGSILGAGAIAGASVGIYFAVKPKPTAKGVKVDVPTIEGLTFKNKQAYVGQDYSTEISIDIAKTGENRLPDELKSVKSGNRTVTNTEYTYDVADNKESANFKIPGKYVEGDIKIDLELVKPTPPGPTTWYLDTTYLNSLTDADVTKEGGEIQTLKVNGLEHRVRLIGVDKDYGTIGDPSTKIHTTWEFADLISDENGYSLATYWNDTATAAGSNYDYTTSTVRNALIGEGNVNWFRFYGLPDGNEDPRNLKFATEANYKISVLDMINNENEGFEDALKTPSKYINIYNSDLATPAWEEKTVEDKLFLLSPAEMGKTNHEYEESSTDAYSYYATDLSGDRVKHQIKWHDGARTDALNDINLDGAYTSSDKYSYAGHNDDKSSRGSYSWLRSPYTNNDGNAWEVGTSGSLNESDSVYLHAFTVAPAFCI